MSEWVNHAEEPKVVRFDAVTLATMLAAGMDPAEWVRGLKREEGMIGGRLVIHAFEASDERRNMARTATPMDDARFDTIKVVDDDGTWRTNPDRQIPLTTGVSWLPRGTQHGMQSRAQVKDRGLLTLTEQHLPETLLVALAGRRLSDLIDLPGFAEATIERADLVGGLLEVVVDAPWRDVSLTAIDDTRTTDAGVKTA